MTNFLYAQPSFVEGWARIIDFGDTLAEYNVSLTPRQADYFAIRQDWATVGSDLRLVAERFRAEARELNGEQVEPQE